MPTVRHSPEGLQTLTINWASLADRAPENLVLASGETVTSSTWDVPPDLTAGATTFGASTSSLVISGGTPGETYTVRCLISTSQGRSIQQATFVETERT